MGVVAASVRRCPACLKAEPEVEFLLEKNGRKRSWCRPCSNRRARGDWEPEPPDLTALEILERFPGQRPKWAAAKLTVNGKRICKACREWLPLTSFRLATKTPRYECKPCGWKRSRAWQEANPERKREHRVRARKRMKARLEIAKEVVDGKTHAALAKVDVMRRLLVEAPPELRTEEERLAYFRGLLAGVKRNAEETERFERLKDLPHRIACERASQRGIGYEEAISAAYEGLLTFMRRKASGFASEEHERKMAAQAIRYAIIDYKRSEGPLGKAGKVRFVGGQAPLDSDGEDALGELAASVDQDDGRDLWERVREKLAGHTRGDVRLGHILRMRIEGHTLREVGEALSLTESRISQILSDEREWMMEHLAPLGLAAAG